MHLVIDRPDRANAITQEMWMAVPGLMADAAAVRGVRAVVLRSASPKVFAAGADLEEYRANAGNANWGVLSGARVGAALAAVRHCPVPTIAAISGACVGGGLGMAIACDFRVASDTSFFALTPARLGLVYPYVDLVELVDLVGSASARCILLTGERVDVEWAVARGLVTEAVGVDQLDAAVTRLVDAICAVSDFSVRSMKRMIALALGGQRTDSVETDGYTREALAGADHVEGTAAFLERRPARFT